MAHISTQRKNTANRPWAKPLSAKPAPATFALVVPSDRKQTITIPHSEERTVALIQELVTLLREYPGVEMKTTVTGPRSVAAGKKKGSGRRSQVSVPSRFSI